MSHLIVEQKHSDGAWMPFAINLSEGGAASRFYSRDLCEQFLEKIVSGVHQDSVQRYQITLIEGLERTSMASGAEVWLAHEPDRPTHYVAITDTSEASIPSNPEVQDLAFRVFDFSSQECVARQVISGRGGLNAWYVEHIGYSPDEDCSVDEGNPGATVPIEQLIDWVATHMIFDAAGGLD